jgi:O-antigen/teichoic acid export membrane protein
MSDLSNSALARIVKINSCLGAVGLFSSILSSMIIFRILPTERYTELALCQAIISYFNLILDLGGGSAFSRYFVEAKAIRATANLFALIRNRRVCYSTILIAFACICGPMYGSNTNFSSLKNDILPWAILDCWPSGAV